MLASLVFATLSALFFGAALGWASVRFRVSGNPIVDQIENILPHTQCGQCGFPGCRAYAEAIAGGEGIERCQPGGEAAIRGLADLLGREARSLSLKDVRPAVALIDEHACIGCTLCIQACPVDAIVGAAKQLHVVIGSVCTGCELCAKSCPVGCIAMQAIPDTIDNWTWRYPLIPVTNRQVGPT